MDYNAVVREYSGKSLTILARVLVADLKDFPADWKVRYRCQEIDKASTSVENLCCCAKNPLQIYKPAKNLFPVTVRTIDGKSLEVAVSSEDTVKVLKLKIFQQEAAYPPMVQELYVNRKGAVTFLCDGHTLKEYRITEECTIYLKQNASAVKALQLGIHFKPIDLDATYERIKGLYKSPAWARFSVGLNICGMCPNPQCASEKGGVKREIVVRDNLQEGLRIDIASGEEFLNCPACPPKGEEGAIPEGILVHISDDDESTAGNSNNFKIVPKCYLLFNARCVMYCKRSGSQQIVAKFFESKPNKKIAYTRIEAGKNIEFMEITTVEPWRSPFCCVKCDTKIGFKAHEILLECGHAYHSWCAPSMLKPKKKRCEVCCSKVLITGNICDVLQTLP